MNEDNPNKTTLLEQCVRKMINDILDEREITLKKEEAEQIVNALLPEMDKIISNRVKEHFVLLADTMKEKFSSR